MDCWVDCCRCSDVWDNQIFSLIYKMNLDLLSWLGNFLNFLIFLYISINVVNTQCFNVSQMTLSLMGLLASIFIQIVYISLKTKM